MFRPTDVIKDSYIADVVSSTEVYHGFYTPGGPKTTSGSLDTSAAQFKIAKETRSSSGNTLSLKWAAPAGALYANYDQVWDDRASLDYI